jgi:hypothetical protein
VVPTIEEVKFIENAKVVPAMPAEDSADAVDESRLEGVNRRNLKFYNLKHKLQVGVSVRT